jgi:hypothetical protein
MPARNHPAPGHAELFDGRPLQRQAEILGYAGLIPFAGLALLVLFTRGEIQLEAGKALVAYGGVIISFLGAWHWGAAMTADVRDDTARRMLFAVSPALLGWMAILLPLIYGLSIIIAGLLLTLLADRYWPGPHPWYHVLRRRLTTVAVLSLSLAMLTTLEII